MSVDKRWYAVHTRPQNETRAEFNLRRQGFVTYLPLYQRIRRHARRAETIARPLFPRYLFVALDMARDRWFSIRSTFGVSNLVLVGEEPAPIPEGIVEEIRRREGGNGYVRLTLPAGVGPGSQIRLIDGVFADYGAVLDRVADESRVAVLLKMLGREVRVFLPAGSIGAA